MPLPTTFAGVSSRGAGMFAKTGYAPLSLSASGVTTSLTYGATSGFGSLSATGGSGNFTYSVYSGNIPLGITLNTSSGYLTGVVGAGPNYATSNGLYPVVFNVYDNVTGLSAQSSSINISSTFTASWLGKSGTSQAIRITTGGTFTSYSLPSNGYSPCAGPDGNMWFRTGAGIVKMDSSYTATVVNSGNTGGGFGMVTASDGNMWSPDYSFSYMLRITTSGTVTSYSPTSGYVGYTCLGPDGNAYAESDGGTLVHRFSTSGSYTGFTLPGGATTLDICASLGGLIYVGSTYDTLIYGYRGRITGYTVHSTVYSMTTSGTFTLIVDNSSNPSNSITNQIATDSSGYIWYDANTSYMFNSSPSGATQNSFSTNVYGALWRGPNGYLWGCIPGTSQVGFFNLPNANEYAVYTYGYGALTGYSKGICSGF